MTTKSAVAIYVDRATQQWIVRDAEDNFWAVPSMDDAWEHRIKFHPSEESDLEPIPAHYKYLLRLPFLESKAVQMTAERDRLEEARTQKVCWKKWGP